MFDRAKIFSNPTCYSLFLRLPLEGSNRIFQEGVRRLLGEDFPFNRLSCAADDGEVLVF